MRRVGIVPAPLLAISGLALVDAPTASASSTHRNYPLGHARSCRPGYAKRRRVSSGDPRRQAGQAALRRVCMEAGCR